MKPLRACPAPAGDPATGARAGSAGPHPSSRPLPGISPASGLFTPTIAADASRTAKPSPPADPAPPFASSPPDADPTPIATAVQFSTLALREKTPIFEEIASAWFAENKPVPGRWPSHAEPQPAGRFGRDHLEVARWFGVSWPTVQRR